MATTPRFLAYLTDDLTIPDTVHFHPAGQGHVLTGEACWCDPHLYRLCTACDGDDPGCWACDGAGILRVAAILPGDRGLIVHHFIPDDARIVRR